MHVKERTWNRRRDWCEWGSRGIKMFFQCTDSDVWVGSEKSGNIFTWGLFYGRATRPVNEDADIRALTAGRWHLNYSCYQSSAGHWRHRPDSCMPFLPLGLFFSSYKVPNLVITTMLSTATMACGSARNINPQPKDRRIHVFTFAGCDMEAGRQQGR